VRGTGDNVEWIARRVALLATLLSPALSAQFSGLASTADGSSLYFASTLRLKSLGQPLNGKVYVATPNGVSLFRAREPSAAPPNAPPCTVGGFADYLAAGTSSAGTVALVYRASQSGGCSYPPNTLMTRIVTAAGESGLPGIARLSSGGRYSLVFLGATARIFNPVSISFLDLQSGIQTPVNVTGPEFPQYIQQPYTGGRVIADDGTAILAITDGGTPRTNPSPASG
jgi:hypothetical protein